MLTFRDTSFENKMVEFMRNENDFSELVLKATHEGLITSARADIFVQSNFDPVVGQEVLEGTLFEDSASIILQRYLDLGIEILYMHTKPTMLRLFVLMLKSTLRSFRSSREQILAPSHGHHGTILG